ncbi:MAG: SemiSWEET transporter [Candidatus Brocadiia bacterium]
MNMLLHGIIAGILTTSAFLPQVIKSWSSHKTEDLSSGMLILLVSGASLWLIYGIRLKDKPIIIANGATLMLVISLVILKIKYG